MGIGELIKNYSDLCSTVHHVDVFESCKQIEHKLVQGF